MRTMKLEPGSLAVESFTVPEAAAAFGGEPRAALSVSEVPRQCSYFPVCPSGRAECPTATPAV